MKFLISAAILLLSFNEFSLAQTDGSVAKKDPQADQYFGVQINDLVRQVFNFSSTTNAVTNPYLLTYSINSKTSGVGFRTGVGYNYTSTSSNDGINAVNTKLNDLSFRAGIDKIIKLTGKWTAGVGIDLVLNMNDDHTTDVVNSTFGGQNTDTKTNTTTYGLGPMGWLRYNITPRILVGTEASFYFITGQQKQTISVTDPNNPGFSVPTTTTNMISQGTINTPVVLFLMVKF